MKNQAFNPFLPEYEYVPDGEPYVFDGRLYIFGSHDKFGGSRFCENDYVGWSADVNDLGNWKYEGVIYRRDQDPSNTDGARPLFAPDVQKGKDGKYYLYYPLRGVGVAVSDTPAGKYEFYGHVSYPDGTRYGRRAGDVQTSDPAIFIDDDGKIYLYTGYTPLDKPSIDAMEKGKRQYFGAYCVELCDDMKTVKGEPRLIVPGEAFAEGTGFSGHGFFEASSMRKIRGRYYFIYSSHLSHELCYAVSDRPNGGFVYGGTIVSIGDIGLNGSCIAKNSLGNTHGSIAEINGEYYIFYHRQTNRSPFSRQGCAERIIIKEDGSIDQVEITSCGLNGAPLIGRGKYRAAIACNLWGARGTWFVDDEKIGDPHFTQDKEDGNTAARQYIADFGNGACAGYKYFDFDGRRGKICVRCKGAGQGRLEVFFSEPCDSPHAKIALSASTEWADFSSEIDFLSGVHPLFFRYVGEGAFDILSFEFI